MVSLEERPILIASPPRCGTTMLAGLLHKHGVWVGRARTTNSPGSNSSFGSENQDIKNVMKQEAIMVNYRNWEVPLPTLPYSNVGVLKDRILSYVPKNTQWLVKTSWTLAFYKFWTDAFPDAKWIFPYRSFDSIIDSINRHPKMKRRKDKQKELFVLGLIRRQDIIQKMLYTKGKQSNYHSPRINNISMKDKEELERLFDFIEIRINWDIVNEWIKPGMLKC